VAGFRYRSYRPDIARDLKALLENCIFASEVEKGEINEAYITARLTSMLQDDYPEHRMAVLNRDVLYDICKEAVRYHLDNANDPVHLTADLNGNIPDHVREVLDSNQCVRRYFRIKDERSGSYSVKRREKLTRDDWEQIREQRHQKEREVGRKGDYADSMIQLADALALEGPIGEQVFELAAGDGPKGY
jgi:hypothetical protein